MSKAMTLTATGLLLAMVVPPSRGETVGWSGDGHTLYGFKSFTSDVRVSRFKPGGAGYTLFAGQVDNPIEEQ